MPTLLPRKTQSLEVVWPQPPAPSPPRPATNRTTFLTDDFEQDPLTEGLNTTLWSNFTYGKARLGNATDTCGQALYGNGGLILGYVSYRKLQPMTVPANATISVHVLLACDTYGSGVTVVLEYSDDNEATWFEAWSSRTLALGEWRRYEFSLPLEGDAFVHLRFRRPADNARYAVVALDRLVSMCGSKGGKSCLYVVWGIERRRVRGRPTWSTRQGVKRCITSYRMCVHAAMLRGICPWVVVVASSTINRPAGTSGWVALRFPAFHHQRALALAPS